jgi:hypothetical protein
MYDRAIRSVTKARHLMRKPGITPLSLFIVGPLLDDGKSGSDLPTFDVDLAFTLLHMSSIIYERFVLLNDPDSGTPISLDLP